MLQLILSRDYCDAQYRLDGHLRVFLSSDLDGSREVETPVSVVRAVATLVIHRTIDINLAAGVGDDVAHLAPRELWIHCENSGAHAGSDGACGGREPEISCVECFAEEKRADGRGGVVGFAGAGGVARIVARRNAPQGVAPSGVVWTFCTTVTRADGDDARMAGVFVERDVAAVIA